MMYSPFGGFSMVLILGVLIVFVVLALRGRDGTSKSETPLDILKRRYAKGEIDKEEFERMKKELGE